MTPDPRSIEALAEALPDDLSSFWVEEPTGREDARDGFREHEVTFDRQKYIGAILSHPALAQALRDGLAFARLREACEAGQRNWFDVTWRWGLGGNAGMAFLVMVEHQATDGSSPRGTGPTVADACDAAREALEGTDGR
mgnify:FL=1